LELGNLSRIADHFEGCKGPPARLAIQVSQPLLLDERESPVHAPANLNTALLVRAQDQFYDLYYLGRVLGSLHAEETLKNRAACSAQHGEIADGENNDTGKRIQIETDAPPPSEPAGNGGWALLSEHLGNQDRKNREGEHEVQNARNGTLP
jgi:hypothetical protein